MVRVHLLDPDSQDEFHAVLLQHLVRIRLRLFGKRIQHVVYDVDEDNSSLVQIKSPVGVFQDSVQQVCERA